MELDQTKKQEYAAKVTLIGLFLSIFTGFASRLTDKKNRRRLESLKPFDLALLALSTYRLGRLVSFDKVFEPLRSFLTVTTEDETGAGKTVKPKGTGARRSLGELISCPICSGTWIAAGLVYMLQVLPHPTRLFLWISSSVGGAELLNALTEALSWFGQASRKEAGESENNQGEK